MVADSSTDKLPPGWKEYVKVKNGRKIKYYSKAATGQKFYSKLAVIRYMNMPISGADTTRPQSETDCNQTTKTPINHRKKASVREPVTDGPDTNRSPVWLPTGWIMEVKTRPGKSATYKIYIDPATGKKFYSQPQVAEYLKALAQKEVPVEKNQDVVESGSVDGLPVGWTKEIKIRHYANGIKRDPYYKDPVSGFVFRSKKDALRYLDTGDISKCSIKPRKRDEPNAVSHEDYSSNELSGHQISRNDQRNISKREVNKVVNYSGEPVISDELQNTTMDGLPIGWRREIKIRRDGHGKDSFYIDPISGYMFRSKKDALRYIETGDISKCACKPKMQDANDIGSAKQASGVQLQCSAEVGLPIGWTKEIQIRKNGIGKDYFYTDPISGYMFLSRKDALRYIETGDVSKCALKPKKRDVNDTGSTKQQISGIQNTTVDGLPIGWTKEIQTRRNGIGKDTFYTDPVSRYMFRSKKDAFRYIETGDISKCAIKPKKRDADDTRSTKHVSSNGVRGQHILRKDQSTSIYKGEKNKSSNNSGEIAKYDQLNNSSVDGLPIGWIREIQTRRDGIGKDAFYTDPVSGYMFRSKIDALRYIETGDIRKCASKPKKKDANAAGSAEHVGDLSTPVSRRNLPRSSSRQHFIGEKSNDENCDVRVPKAVKSERSLRKRGSSLPSTIERKSRRVSQPSEQEFLENIGRQSADSRSSYKRISQSTPFRTSKRLAGCQPEMPNLQVSERDLRAAMKMSCENEANILPMITTNAFPNGLPQPFYPEPASDANPSNKQELQKEKIKKKVNRNTPANPKKSNQRIAPSTHGRTSNRQTGSSNEFPSNPQLSERSLGAEMRKSSEDEAHVFPWININDVPDVVVPQPFHSELSTTTAVGMPAEGEPYPLDTEPAAEVADIVSMVVVSISNMDEGQKCKEHSSQKITEKQNVENFKPQDVQGDYQFVNPLPDPFLNFTFNNPTGATPDEDNMTYQGYSEQQTSNPFVQGNDNSGWSGSQNLGYSQDVNPSLSNSANQQAQVDQLPSQFSFVAHGFNVPSFNNSDSQQPASDNRNDNIFKRNP